SSRRRHTRWPRDWSSDVCSSELGVITEAWVRVQPRPTHRRSAAVRFHTFAEGAECVRALSQSGLEPANCRLIDAAEARLAMAGEIGRASCRERVYRRAGEVTYKT